MCLYCHCVYIFELFLCVCIVSVCLYCYCIHICIVTVCLYCYCVFVLLLCVHVCIVNVCLYCFCVYMFVLLLCVCIVSVCLYCYCVFVLLLCLYFSSTCPSLHPWNTVAGQGYKHRSLQRTNCISIEAMLLKSYLHWTGHVIRMEDQRIPKQLLFGELEQGHRRQGRPCKRFKDTVKAGLQWCDIPPTELVATALDRQRWRTLSQSASSALEEERRHQAQSTRERRHLSACIPATNANFQCPDCTRLCKSTIGLQSHSRTHR